MLNFIMPTVRYMLTLFFGVFVTTSIIGIKNNKKNILILNAFCIIDLLLYPCSYTLKAMQVR